VVLAKSEVIQLTDLPDAFRAVPAVSIDSELSIKKRLPALEKALIQQALVLSEGNRSQAAKSLEISYKALLYKIRDYGLGTKDKAGS
jgi:two-component system response regulator AtoC